MICKEKEGFKESFVRMASMKRPYVEYGGSEDGSFRIKVTDGGIRLMPPPPTFQERVAMDDKPVDIVSKSYVLPEGVSKALLSVTFDRSRMKLLDRTEIGDVASSANSSHKDEQIGPFSHLNWLVQYASSKEGFRRYREEFKHDSVDNSLPHLHGTWNCPALWARWLPPGWEAQFLHVGAFFHANLQNPSEGKGV